MSVQTPPHYRPLLPDFECLKSIIIWRLNSESSKPGSNHQRDTNNSKKPVGFLPATPFLWDSSRINPRKPRKPCKPPPIRFSYNSLLASKGIKAINITRESKRSSNSDSGPTSPVFLHLRRRSAMNVMNLPNIYVEKSFFVIAFCPPTTNSSPNETKHR